MSKQKYRPVFSAIHLQKIHNLAIKDFTETGATDSLKIIGIVAPFLAKIDSGSIVPAYTEKPSKEESLLYSLGGETSIQITQTKEQYWEACYNKLLATPNDCSLKEIDAAKEWKYLNGLMSEEEIEAFESNGFNL